MVHAVSLTVRHFLRKIIESLMPSEACIGLACYLLVFKAFPRCPLIEQGSSIFAYLASLNDLKSRS